MTKTPSTLAERFWSLARVIDGGNSDDPIHVVKHVLAVLDALDTGQQGADLTAHTVSFLTLLRQKQAQGDLHYASPEQARGESMDERSLVFSVGVLLFEKLTGRHPFGADGNPRRLARMQKAEMASGVAYFQTISSPLRSILLKCMGPFPEERWSSMAELRTQLESLVAGKVLAPKTNQLPALPYDEEQTKFVVRPASPKTPSHHPSTQGPLASDNAMNLAAERESGRRFRSVAEPRVVSTQNIWLGRVAWMAAGILVAFIAVLIFAPGSPPSNDLVAQVTPKIAAQPALPVPAPPEQKQAAEKQRAAEAQAAEAKAAEERAVATQAALIKASQQQAAAEAKADAIRAAEEKAAAEQAAKEQAAAEKQAAAEQLAADAKLDAEQAANQALQAAATATKAAREAKAAAMKADLARAVASGQKFDPKLGGEAALDVVVGCFTPLRRARGLELGVSVRFGRDGQAKRVYFGGGKRHLSHAERECVVENLLSIHAGGPPEKPVSVSYTLWIKKTDSWFQSHVTAE